MGGNSEFVNPLERFPKFSKLIEARQPQVTANADITKMAQTMRQQLDWNGITQPVQNKMSTFQIDSSSIGDTVLLTGLENKSLRVTSISSYDGATGGAEYRYELDTGTAFGTTLRISQTNTVDKETQGQIYVLKYGDRIVLNVTTLQAGSTIDVVVCYEELGWGTVYAL
tara:strand:+ start:3499 stop:4005 length:507 start_codon:yes stop_codon:yes gene_type:complete